MPGTGAPGEDGHVFAAVDPLLASLQGILWIDADRDGDIGNLDARFAANLGAGDNVAEVDFGFAPAVSGSDDEAPTQLPPPTGVTLPVTGFHSEEFFGGGLVALLLGLAILGTGRYLRRRDEDPLA